MKTIFNPYENQIEGIETLFKGMNPLNEGMERVFVQMKKRPGWVICGIWIFITGIDSIIRYVGAIPLAPFPVILVNFFGGLGLSLLLFLHLSPLIFIKKKWLSGIFQLTLILVIYLIIKYSIVEIWADERPVVRNFIGYEASRFFHYALYIIFIWGFYIDGIRQELHKKMEVEHLKLMVEHKSSQLSPHFVLNWISSFFIQVKDVSPKLSHQLSLFTEVLSYSYKNPNHPNSLGQEIRVVESYLESQQFRFKNKLNLKVSINLRGGNPGELHFPKWILMTLVENIFKHGNCLNSKLPCLVNLDLFPNFESGNTMNFSLTNDLNTANPVSPSGFGIKAVKRILSYYFPKRFQLLTHQSEIEFCLFLEVQFISKRTDLPSSSLYDPLNKRNRGSP